MIPHYISGKTGTIGRHMNSNSIGLSIDLENVSKKEISEIVPNFSHFTHLAGIVGEGNVRNDPEKAYRINVLGTLRLAETLLENQLTRFTYISTSHVYGKANVPVCEDSNLDPIGLYSNQKLETELELTEIFATTGTELTILRVFSLLDWDVKEFTLGGAIKRIAKGDKSVQIQNADDVRDFLTPKQAGRIIENIAQLPNMSGVWNVSTGVGRTVRSAVSIMMEKVENLDFSRQLLQGNSDQPYLVGNNQKLSKVLPLTMFEWKPGKLD